MKRGIDTVMIVLAVVLLAGCGGRSQQHPWGTLKECEDENTNLSLQVQTLQSQNDQLTEQVTTLSALDGKTRLAALDTIDTIRIGKYTGFYDKDENGTKEMLVVYLEPFDTAQDTIKAAGMVKVELWDLNAPENKAKLSEWTVKPDQLHATWSRTIFRSYYRLTFPVIDLLPDQKNRVGTAHPTELTVKVTFTDLLSGKVLTDQTTIAP